MNIFAISRSVKRCARTLDDKRLNKMILEAAQVICTVLNLEADEQVTPYKNSHVGNACTLWAARDRENLYWLYNLGIAYGEEIIHRFGRKHACHLLLEGLTFKFPEFDQCSGDPDSFHNGARHQGLGLDFTHLPVHRAYKTYLAARWPGDKRKPVWTKRERPSWA